MGEFFAQTNALLERFTHQRKEQQEPSDSQEMDELAAGTRNSVPQLPTFMDEIPDLGDLVYRERRQRLH